MLMLSDFYTCHNLNVFHDIHTFYLFIILYTLKCDCHVGTSHVPVCHFCEMSCHRGAKYWPNLHNFAK